MLTMGRTVVPAGIAVMMLGAPIGVHAANLTVAYAPASLSATYEAIATEFEADNPGVDVQLINAADYDQLTQDLLRNAITNTLPDVAHQGTGTMRILPDKGLAVPLEPFIAADVDWSHLGYSQAVLDTCTIAAKVYCLPFAVSVPVLFYNRNLVEQVGGNPNSFPDNWTDIIDLAEKIDALGDDVSGIYYTIEGNSTYPFQTLMETAGGEIMSADETHLTLAEEPGLTALQIVGEIGKAGMIDMTTDHARQTFSAGQLGIFMINSSNFGRLTAQSGGSFEIGIAPLPSIVETNSQVPVAGSAVVMLATDAERQALAWNWMKFATSAKTQAKLAMDTGYAPTNPLALDLPEVQEFYQTHPQLLVAAKEMARGTIRYNFPGDNSIRIGDAIENIMLEVVRGREDPESGIARMRAEVSALLGM